MSEALKNACSITEQAARKIIQAGFMRSLRSTASIRQGTHPRVKRQEMVITLYEGSAVKELVKYSSQFAAMCSRPGSEIPEPYIRSSLNKSDARNMFAMLATDPVTGKAVAYAKCSVYARLQPMHHTHIVFVDLVCACPSTTKGAGRVLLGEIEEYAKNLLKANIIVLQSLAYTPTINSYRKMGYARGYGSDTNLLPASHKFHVLEQLITSKNRSADAWRTALGACTSSKECHALVMETLNQNLGGLLRTMHNKNYMDKLMGEWYPGYNNLGDTVVMSKELQPPGGRSRVRWEGKLGMYYKPSKIQFARYKTNTQGIYKRSA